MTIRAHPRSRGENVYTEIRSALGEGSSPLTRGKPDNTTPRKTRGRLIPAHAGKTPGYREDCHDLAAHPRSRGENTEGGNPGILSFGSSPLTRGKQRRAGVGMIRPRLIPAHAGKTKTGRGRYDQTAAHPRSRGENCATTSTISSPSGSSPLTRGKLMSTTVPPCAHRLIPAHAGKTRRRSPRAPGRAAHPRSRGENPAQARARRARDGSSPLTRGKPHFHSLGHLGLRLIPAHAGKTRERPPS